MQSVEYIHKYRVANQVDIHVNDFASLLMGSEFCDTESLPNDFVSFITESELCETDSLPELVFAVFSVRTDMFPLTLAFGPWILFDLVVLEIAYGSTRCKWLEVTSIYTSV